MHKLVELQADSYLHTIHSIYDTSNTYMFAWSVFASLNYFFLY